MRRSLSLSLPPLALVCAATTPLLLTVVESEATGSETGFDGDEDDNGDDSMLAAAAAAAASADDGADADVDASGTEDDDDKEEEEDVGGCRWQRCNKASCRRANSIHTRRARCEPKSKAACSGRDDGDDKNDGKLDKDDDDDDDDDDDVDDDADDGGDDDAASVEKSTRVGCMRIDRPPLAIALAKNGARQPAAAAASSREAAAAEADADPDAVEASAPDEEEEEEAEGEAGDGATDRDDNGDEAPRAANERASGDSADAAASFAFPLRV